MSLFGVVTSISIKKKKKERKKTNMLEETKQTSAEHLAEH